MEYKILQDTPATIQKTLNQWKHQFELVILAQSALPNGTLIITLTRTPK